jgi:hypothetical protein
MPSKKEDLKNDRVTPSLSKNDCHLWSDALAVPA